MNYLQTYDCNDKTIEVTIEEVDRVNGHTVVHCSKCCNVPVVHLVRREEVWDLWDADPNCHHEVVDAPGGGVKCTKCRGWFCY